MRNPAAFRWTIGTVFLAIILAAATYMLILMPTMDATAEAREFAEAEQVRIDQLEIQLAGLQADAKNLEQFRAELAELQIQLPTSLLLPELTRQLDGIAEDAEVTLTSVTPGIPYEVRAPVSAAPPPPPVEPEDGESDENATDGEDGAAVPPPTEPVGPLLPGGFYAVPVQLNVVGTYDATVDFLEALQLENPRLFLVHGLAASALEQSGAQGGRPAVADGDLESQVSFLAYVLLDNVGLEAGDDPSAEAPALPTPGDGNPFEPLR